MKVQVRFRASSRGGRKTLPERGYAAVVHFPGFGPSHWSASFIFEETPKLDKPILGVLALLAPGAPTSFGFNAYFEVREGKKIIADGEVLEHE